MSTKQDGSCSHFCYNSCNKSFPHQPLIILSLQVKKLITPTRQPLCPEDVRKLQLYLGLETDTGDSFHTSMKQMSCYPGEILFLISSYNTPYQQY